MLGEVLGGRLPRERPGQWPSGGLHYDEERNLDVQVRGETQYVILPLNFTGAATDRFPPYPSFNGLQEDPHT